MLRIFPLLFVLFFTLNSLAINENSIAVYLNAKYSIPIEYTEEVLSKAEVLPNVKTFVQRVANSPEKIMPFDRFVKFFVNDKRINDGVIFLKQHKILLNKIYKKYGVNPCVIVSILSIETNLGQAKLSTNALDALYTLAQYSRRKEYFLNELESFIIYTYEYHKSPFNLKGSITGALGLPQFMPSNILKYAVDFNGNGLNLNELDDALASIANYLVKHGYKKGNRFAMFLGKNCKVRGNVLRVKYTNATKCWLVFNNFWALKRYNGTVNYALASYLLSKAICSEMK